MLVDLDSDGYFAYDVALTGANSTWFWSWKKSAENNNEWEMEMGVTLDGWAAYPYKLWIEKECVEAFERSLSAIKGLLEASNKSD